MHARLGAVLEALRAVRGFLDDRSTTVAPVNDSAARKTLDSLVGQLTAQAVDQSAGRVSSQGETSLQKSLRYTLRQFHMKPIAEAARAGLRDVPEMSAFVLPPDKTSSVRLVAAAGGMADAATKHVDAFIAGGLAPDFITELTATAAELNQSVDARAKSTGRSIGATNALKALEKPTRDVIRVLDALVVPKIAHDDRLLGEWRAAKRIRRKTGPANGTATPVSSPTPPQPSVEKPV